MKIRPHAIQDVDEFVSSSEQIKRNLTGHHLQDINWWTGVVCIIVMFLSAVWTLILTAPIHYRACIAETLMHFSKSDEETLVCISEELMVRTISAIFISDRTIPYFLFPFSRHACIKILLHIFVFLHLINNPWFVQHWSVFIIIQNWEITYI